MLPTGTVLQESTVPLFWNDGAISAGFFTERIQGIRITISEFGKAVKQEMRN